MGNATIVKNMISQNIQDHIFVYEISDNITTEKKYERGKEYSYPDSGSILVQQFLSITYDTSVYGNIVDLPFQNVNIGGSPYKRYDNLNGIILIIHS